MPDNHERVLSTIRSIETNNHHDAPMAKKADLSKVNMSTAEKPTASSPKIPVKLDATKMKTTK